MNKRKPNPILEEIYNKHQNGCCFYCKEKVDFQHITRDHFYPRSKGFTCLYNNTVFACAPCNSTKGSKTIEEFKLAIEKKLKDYVDNNIWRGRVRNHSAQVRKAKIMRLENVIKTCKEILEGEHRGVPAVYGRV